MFCKVLTHSYYFDDGNVQDYVGGASFDGAVYDGATVSSGSLNINWAGGASVRPYALLPSNLLVILLYNTLYIRY